MDFFFLSVFGKSIDNCVCISVWPFVGGEGLEFFVRDYWVMRNCVSFQGI